MGLCVRGHSLSHTCFILILIIYLYYYKILMHEGSITSILRYGSLPLVICLFTYYYIIVRILQILALP